MRPDNMQQIWDACCEFGTKYPAISEHGIEYFIDVTPECFTAFKQEFNLEFPARDEKPTSVMRHATRLFPDTAAIRQLMDDYDELMTKSQRVDPVKELPKESEEGSEVVEEPDTSDVDFVEEADVELEIAD